MAWVAASLQQVVQHCQTVAAERLTPTSPELWLTLLPAVLYWVVAGFFDLLDQLQIPAVEQYRIHSAKEQQQRNHISRAHVFWRVLLQHAIRQTEHAAAPHVPSIYRKRWSLVGCHS